MNTNARASARVPTDHQQDGMTQVQALPDPVQWYEGMLLTPQHFQQAWLREEALIQYHVNRLSPFHFGVRTFAVDATRLVVGVFRVTALEAVMPDGMVVRHPAENAGDLEINIGGLGDAMKDGPMTVHLVVPVYRAGAAVRGQQARFEAVEGPPAVDENTGDNEQPVLRMRPRLGLQVGDDVPGRYVSMPVARVIYRDEAFRLTEYVPPCFALGRDSPLVELGRHLARRLREKATFLAGRLRAPPGSMQATLVADTRSAVQCLVAGLPSLEALLDTPDIHPFALHMCFCAVAGHVATLGPGLVPPVFDPYDHSDPRGSMQPVLSFVERMIDTVSDTYVVIRFAAETSGFRLKIEPAWIRDDGLVVGVRLAPGQTGTDAEAWVAESLIASGENMGVVRERRLRGAARRRIDHDDRLGVVPERGVLLFRIAMDPSYIEPSRVLEIDNPGDRQGVRRPAEIVLFTASPTAGAPGT